MGFYLQNNKHIEEMVHSGFDGEYIIIAVVIYKSLSQRKTLFIILTFGTTSKQILDDFFLVVRDLGSSEMICSQEA